MADYRQTYADEQKKFLMSQALAKQAMTPTQRPQGRIVASTGAADGLMTLATALASRRAGKQATALGKQGDEERRKAQAAALSGMGRPPNAVETPEAQDPYMRAQGALEAGIDPNLVGAYMQTKAPQKPAEVSAGADLVDPVTGKVLHHNTRDAAGATGIPGSLQELAAINSDREARGEPPMKPEEYLAQRRGSSADSQLYAQYIQGLPDGVKPLPMDQFLVQFRGASAGSESGARTTATSAAENAVALPDALSDIQKMSDNIKGLVESPGFGQIYGIRGAVDPRNYIPGTNAANSQARREQIDAQAFGVAIQKMKGLGSLSNAEGSKVSAAFTRATNPKISPEEAKGAWDEVQSYLELAALRAQKKAGMKPVAAPSAATAPPTGAAAPTAPASDQAPAGVDPATWKFMTPEERKLWQ